MNNFIAKISSSQHLFCSSILVLSSTKFQPWDFVSPEDNVGFCLFACQYEKVESVLYWRNSLLTNCLREQNSGCSSSETRSFKRRPSAVLAFVPEFTTHNLKCNRDQRKHLESIIQHKTSTLAPKITASGLQVFAKICNKFAEDKNLNL